MRKKNPRGALKKIGVGSAIALILSGCANHSPSHLKSATKTSDGSAVVSHSTPGNGTPTRPVSAPTSAAASRETPIPDQILSTPRTEEEEIALGDDEFLSDEESANGVEDPTVEDESEVGAALFDAAQDLLGQSTLNDEALVSDDIWQRVRSGFALPDRDHPRVQPDREWFSKNQAYLDRTFIRAAPYMHYIVEEVERRNIPLEIALLPVVESAFQPFAYSRSHAAGIWQFIPGTANVFGLKMNWWYDGRRDIHASTHAALNYLQKLHNQFNGDWLLALAAYNSGEGTVGRAIAKNESLGLGTRYWDLDLPRETEHYVPRLLAITDIVENPEKFGLSIHTIPNKPLLTLVNTGAQLDLAIAADMAGLTLDELYTLNPGFNRWATAPNGPHHLLLPHEKVETFRGKLASLPDSQRMQWARHEIKRGENLGRIAKQYGVTVAAIQRANKMSGNTIHPGQTLTIPTASRASNAYLLASDQRTEAMQAKARGQGRVKLTHTVRGGDTLWKISTKHNVDVRSLAAWNDMSPSDTLRKGQKLVVWKDGRSGATRVSKNDRGVQKVKYRVRSGDSLARISNKFNVTVRELREWNPGVRGKHIQPGQQLIVFVDTTRVTEKG